MKRVKLADRYQKGAATGAMDARCDMRNDGRRALMSFLVIIRNHASSQLIECGRYTAATLPYSGRKETSSE